jgi:hypothetical protein
MKIVAVRIGEKYGPEYEAYLERKLPEHEFIWVREAFDPRIQLQWNKMHGMQLDIDEPICVMDIDMLLVNDYQKVFDYPIERGQFLAMPGWWRDTSKSEYKINGGFFKYYPRECKYIFDKFMAAPAKWQQWYLDNGVTSGPVNGDQNFVVDSVKERLELIVLPDAWFTRWVAEDHVIGDKSLLYWNIQTTNKYMQLTGNDYIYLGGDFHEDIKLVHFTHRNNKPHNWEDYDEHI